MKFWKLAGVLCLCPLAWGQGSRFDSNVFTSASNVPPGAQAPMYTLPSALITVCAYPATGNPCTNVVNVYSDPGLTQIIRQPIKADVHGRFGFWAAPGQYAYSVVAGQAVIGTFNFSLAGDGGGSATFPSSPGIVWNLNSSAGRNATAADVTGLFSGTSPCFLMKDGTCGTAGNGTVSNFFANSWPTWLVPSVANSTTTPSLSVTASPIPNSALANASTTINSTVCALGGTCTIPFNTIYPPAGIAQSNGTNWLPSLAAPVGSLVGTTDTQTLINKTVNGVTPATFAFLDPSSSVQTQLNGKAPLASPSFTGTATAVNLTVTGTCTGCGTGSMTWPATPGIMVYAGSNAYGTSITAPTGALVGTTDTQTLTNKTLTSPTLTAPTTDRITVTGTGIPIATGTASNSDLAGQITLTGGTGTYTLTATYLTAPIVVCSDATAVAAVKCVATTTTITATGTGTDVINYIVIGRT